MVEKNIIHPIATDPVKDNKSFKSSEIHFTLNSSVKASLLSNLIHLWTLLLPANFKLILNSKMAVPNFGKCWTHYICEYMNISRVQ